jgi:SAM-dependent methyltransferase
VKHDPSRCDRHAVLDLYRRRAPLYDLELLAFEPVRRHAIDRLALQRDQTVLDLGCGTGLSFASLEACIGPHGRIVGVEQSPEMIALARQRVGRADWHNVTLLCDAAETAAIAPRADAALFHFTHDILQSSAALANVAGHLKPGAHVVASGLVWAPWWAWPVNLAVQLAALHSVAAFDGLAAPWRRLAEQLDGLQVERLMAGGVFVASGRWRAAA